MTILSVLFGIGVGAFRKLARPDRMAISQIKEALRSARLFARSEGAPASVSVQPAENAVAAFGLRTVGNWHFEDDTGTGWPFDAVYDPGSLDPDGALGSALRLDSGTPLALPSPPPSFDSPYGFGIDVYVRPLDAPRPMTLLERAGMWSMGLDAEGSLVVSLQLVGPDGPQQVRHVASGASPPPDVFSRVTVQFDGRTLSIALDGARVGEDLAFDEPRRLVLNHGVSISTGRSPEAYRGALDELRLLSVVATDQALLPPEVQLLGGAQLLRIDAAGHLDPAWHRTPMTITLEHGDPPRRSVVEVGLLGTVRSRDLGESPPAAPVAAGDAEAGR